MSTAQTNEGRIVQIGTRDNPVPARPVLVGLNSPTALALFQRLREIEGELPILLEVDQELRE